ncbi:hypothetical protein [Bacillus subtilis]|uniref:Uncharacterized protein n=1 Tax=Bacillus subtilis TaxID=1423 RepID=A0A8I1WDV2_BACIU|nr:hypothetical protein [Bacillus subtilis]KAF2421662.1 hypothetical protein B6K89_20940 [Bacillus subtilis]MBO3794238.1 hypothetical protein [Bacillus subtilis]MED3626625.1 hypothetical protein [Bacillus subtilis]
MRGYNHLKRTTCTGDVINGGIYESLIVAPGVKEKSNKTCFRIDVIKGLSSSGKEITRSVGVNLTLGQIKELKKELSQVIDQMEKKKPLF